MRDMGMGSPIDVKLILCDAAVAEPGSGKVHMLGAGWSVTSSPTPQQSVVVLMKIPWDRANQPISFVLQLFDSDGRPVRIETPPGSQEIKFEGQVEVGRPLGVAAGSDLDASLALNVPSLPLTPARYQWRLDISDQTFDVSFQVRQRHHS
jgi:hypothetical protein